MIYLLHGENEFLKRQRLLELTKQSSKNLDRVDGEELDEGRLRELLFGQTLFETGRFVVISGLSESDIWQKIPEIISDKEVEAVFLENKVDKRTKTYKWLQKNAKSEEFTEWGDRDRQRAISWCVERSAQQYGVKLTNELATKLVDRLGYDQLRLDATLEQFSLAGKADLQTLDNLVPLPKTESVFDLLKAALNGDIEGIKHIVSYLESTDGAEGAYRTMGLLVSQAIVLNGLVLGGGSDNLAVDLSINPYAINPWRGHASKLSKAQIGQINSTLGQADMSIKTTGVSPWLIIETAMVEVANIIK